MGTVCTRGEDAIICCRNGKEDSTCLRVSRSPACQVVSREQELRNVLVTIGELPPEEMGAPKSRLLHGSSTERPEAASPRSSISASSTTNLLRQMSLRSLSRDWSMDSHELSTASTSAGAWIAKEGKHCFISRWPQIVGVLSTILFVLLTVVMMVRRPSMATSTTTSTTSSTSSATQTITTTSTSATKILTSSTTTSSRTSSRSTTSSSSSSSSSSRSSSLSITSTMSSMSTSIPSTTKSSISEQSDGRTYSTSTQLPRTAHGRETPTTHVASREPRIVQHRDSLSSTSQSSSQAVVFVRLTVQHLNYAKLTALSETLAAFRQTVHEAIACMVNVSLAPQQFSLELNPGSVSVKARIRDLSPVQIHKWKSETHATEALKANLEDGISGIAGIDSACTGPITVTDIEAGTQKSPQVPTSMTTIVAVAIIVVNTVFVIGMLFLARLLAGPSQMPSLVRSSCHTCHPPQVEAQPRTVSAATAASLASAELEGKAVQKSRWPGFGREWDRPQDQTTPVRTLAKHQRVSPAASQPKSMLQTIFETESDAASSHTSANGGDVFVSRARELGFSDKIALEVLEECGGNQERALAMLSAA